MDSGAEIDAKCDDGYTPFHTASYHQNVTTANFLISPGASTSMNTQGKRCPLHLVCRHGLLCEVRRLLGAGCDSRQPGDNLQTPLHEAVKSCRKEAVEMILEAGADVNATDMSHCTPLHDVHPHIGESIVRILLQAGAKVNTRDKKGLTPLNTMCYGGAADRIIYALLEAGLDVNHVDIYLCTLLHYAVYGRNKRMIDSSSTIKILLHAGDKLNVREILGLTLLNYAASHGVHNEVIYTLLEAGADIETIDANLRIPLHNAACNGHITNERALLYYGARINAREKSRLTPLNLVACYGKRISLDGPYLLSLSNEIPPALIPRVTEMIHTLLLAGPDVNNADCRLCTPLHYAASRGLESIAIHGLLTAGADVNSKDYILRTPLHYALHNSTGIATLRALLAVGADINARDEDGYRPLDREIVLCNYEKIRLLISAGATLPFTRIIPAHEDSDHWVRYHYEFSIEG